jgi:hypothetical protein
MIDEEFMLTTLDNPYNPFTQYDDWYSYDTTKGYNTCAYLARVAKSSELDEDQAIDQAMNEIVDHNILGNYIKVDKHFEIRTINTKSS